MNTEAGSSPAAPVSPPPSAFALRSLIRYWLPVLLWMSLIYSMSTGLGSTRHTSRIIGPILRWFNPNIPDETIWRIQLTLRKTGHVTEYAILALLLWRARRRPVAGDRRPWDWREAGIALALTVLFAISDEWHQSFVPSREGSVRDVLIDTAGASAGLLGFWWRGKQRRRW